MKQVGQIVLMSIILKTLEWVIVVSAVSNMFHLSYCIDLEYSIR